MTTTAITERRHKAVPAYFKAIPAGDGVPEGTFDAIVAVYNNVDLGGDRIIPGAFAKSIDRWKASGDPVPVIFSHQWDDLNAHIGTVDPSNLKELLPGDPELPAELMNLGGLRAKNAQIDLGAPGEAGDFAKNVWRKMKSRALKEFSFAYDIGQARPTKDAMDLLELDLIELGPTLKGMNPATALLGAKAARKAIEGMNPSDALDLLDGLLPPPPAHSGKTKTTDTPGEVGTKRLPTGSRPEGAVETILDAIQASARVWGMLKYGNDLYAVHLEGTFLDQSKALITAERWEDPYGEGPLWELSYTLDTEGATITNANAVEVTVSINSATDPAAKQRAKAYIDHGIDRKTAIWLCVLDDQSVDTIYAPADPAVTDPTQGSTGFAARASYADHRKRGQARGADEAKGEEPSAAASPIGVLLEIEELELNS